MRRQWVRGLSRWAFEAPAGLRGQMLSHLGSSMYESRNPRSSSSVRAACLPSKQLGVLPGGLSGAPVLSEQVLSLLLILNKPR